MQKTGESSTTARAHLRKQKPTATMSPAPPNYAKLAGRSDVTLKENTGCTWERWVKALDRAKAYTWPHREIAKHVREKYKVPSWWAQTVTVGYERIKGLRAGPLDAGRGPEGPDRHPRKVDADLLARSDGPCHPGHFCSRAADALCVRLPSTFIHGPWPDQRKRMQTTAESYPNAPRLTVRSDVPLRFISFPP